MRHHKGFSIIELLVVLAVAAVLLIIAAPSFINYLQINRLVGTANNLYFALQVARTEALKRNTSVFVSVRTGSNWCYGFNAGASCNCLTANSCGLGRVSAPNTQLSLSTSGVTGNSFSFEPIHGAANITGIITFTTTKGTATAMGVKVSRFGSIRVCSSQVSGYQAC